MSPPGGYAATPACYLIQRWLLPVQSNLLRRSYSKLLGYSRNCSRLERQSRILIYFARIFPMVTYTRDFLTYLEFNRTQTVSVKLSLAPQLLLLFKTRKV